MKTLTITLLLIAMTKARPDVSHLISGNYLPAAPGGDAGQEDKHIYFYAAPEDHYYTHFKINVVPKTKKNTKVIFVKAPHHAGVIPEVIAPPSLAEDKTLVYVLVKKPIGEQAISIPSGLDVKHGKPEVFFVKYNNKQEADAQINGGIEGQPIGTNVPDLPNEQSFIDALESHGADNSSHDESSKEETPGESGPY